MEIRVFLPRAGEQAMCCAAFILGTGPIVEQKVKEARTLKILEGALGPKSGVAVAIDIVESSIKLKVSKGIW